MLRLYLRRRVERLADDLADVVGRPLRNPFAQECIVVQSLGMQRWLEMSLATRTGVWANGWFPFPEAFTRKLRRDVLGENGAYASDRPLDRAGLTWAIAAAIAAEGDAPAFAPLRAYLRRDETSGRLIALARRIADVFHGYQLHRPDMLLAWENGEDGAGEADDAWQPALWRAAVARLPERDHAARRAARIIDALDRGREPRDPDFERVSVFGLSTISPLYLRVLTALARHVDVHVFALAASPVDARALARCHAVGRLDGLRAPDAGAAADVPPAGHPLLGSLAGVAREFQLLAGAAADTIAYDDDDDGDTRDHAAAGAPDARTTALGALQRDLGADRVTVRPGLLARLRDGRDASVTVHACHGPLREVEVLRDQLLSAFAADPSLEPHDVVVMTPDIDAYAPYVEAVFGATQLDGARLPFAIADRPGRDALAVVQAFGQLLRVLRGRFTAPEVMDLLALPAIRARLALEPADVDAIRDWVAASGIRWAADADHRRAVAQPADEANTWRFGLDRLLLGFAVGDDAPGQAAAVRHGGSDGAGDADGADGAAAGSGCFLGVLPAVDAIGAPARLGALAAFVARLSRARTDCIAPRSAAAWAPPLLSLLADFVAEEDRDAWQHLRLREAIVDLVERAEAVGFTADLSLDSVADQILGGADADDAARGFLSGGITVCALAPMRSIPFRVVALLGMNDAAFPRPSRPFAFDLVPRAPRLGDRRARDDDRFLFLEALLAARDRLIVTFAGQSERDNGRRPPSVVVSELLDALLALEPSAAAAPPGAPRVTADDLVVWHPLQPFSPRYFAPGGDARVFSFAGAYVDSARRLSDPNGRAPRPSFLASPLPPLVGGRPRTIDLRDLCAFVRSPAGYVLARRLGLAFPDDDAPLEGREPLALDGLGRYAVGQAALVDRLAGHGRAAAAERARARGIVPLGAPGAIMLEAILDQVDAIAGEAKPWLAEPPRPPHPFELPLPAADARLVGSLRGVRRAGLARCGFARVRPDKELDLWVEHLVLGALVAADAFGGPASGAPVAPVSRRIGRPGDAKRDPDGAAHVRYDRVADPLATLSELAALCLEGETHWVPFLPATSHAFAAAIAGPLGGGDDETSRERKAFHAARVRFEPARHRDGPAGESEDAAVRLLVGGNDPFGADDADGATWRAEFARLARAVFGPLLAARVDAGGAADGSAVQADAVDTAVGP